MYIRFKVKLCYKRHRRDERKTMFLIFKTIDMNIY